jgi:hypothetical protein
VRHRTRRHSPRARIRGGMALGAQPGRTESESSGAKWWWGRAGTPRLRRAPSESRSTTGLAWARGVRGVRGRKPRLGKARRANSPEASRGVHAVVQLFGGESPRSLFCGTRFETPCARIFVCLGARPCQAAANRSGKLRRVRTVGEFDPKPCGGTDSAVGIAAY